MTAQLTDDANEASHAHELHREDCDRMLGLCARPDRAGAALVYAGLFAVLVLVVTFEAVTWPSAARVPAAREATPAETPSVAPRPESCTQSVVSCAAFEDWARRLLARRAAAVV
jgi:hypothetical protein